MNDGNLIQNSKLTPRESREFCRKGGIASGKARRKKALFREAVQAFLKSDISPEFEKNVRLFFRPKKGKKSKGVELVVASVIKAAFDGDLKAVEMLMKLGGTMEEVGALTTQRTDVTTNGKDIQQQPLTIEVIDRTEDVLNKDEQNNEIADNEDIQED